MAESSETSILNTSVGDQAAVQDSLGFTPYVRAIAEFLTNDQTKPPLTMSIEGEWGSGKSSFMKQLQKEIELSQQKALEEKIDNFEKKVRRGFYRIFYDYDINESRYEWLKIDFQWKFIKLKTEFFLNLWKFLNYVCLWIIDKILSLLINIFKSVIFLLQRKPRTVWFNAWRHDKAEALWAAFALEFIRQISTNRNLSDVIPTFIGHCKLFISRFDPKSGWLDALRKFTQLILVISVIVLVVIFSVFQGNQWVGQLSTQVNNLNTILENKKDVKPIPKNSPKNLPPYQAKELSQIPNFGEKSEFIESSKSPRIGGFRELDNLDKKTEELFVNSQTYQVGLHNESQNNPFYKIFGVAGIGGSSLAVLSLLKQLQKLVGDPKKELTHYLNSPNYQGQIAFVEKFHSDFAKIVRAYCGNHKVYVFIDDLDRCELAKSAELMQALNLMITDDPSIIFLLGMDREKVAAGLAVKQKDLLPYLFSDGNIEETEKEASRASIKGLEYAYAFIEKFIQIPFVVPQPSIRNFDNFFKTTPPKLSLISQGINFYKKLNEDFNHWQQNLKNFFIKKQPEQKPDLEKPIQVPQQIIPQPQKIKPQPSRRQKLKLLATEDSTTINRMTEMVASAMDYNPRRLKQFANLFRLRAYIASDTGLFDEVYDPSNDAVTNSPLTLEQLGKFTAISLKWPLLITDLENHPNLLANLEDYGRNHRLRAWQPEASQPRKNLNLDNLIDYWSRRQKLRELLCYVGEKSAENYSFANLEVAKLLQVSPKGGHQLGQNQSFQENLGNDCWIKMVEIPSGKFRMGSPETEPDRYDNESPQHEVTISSFFMAEFPVTQVQWREVASLRPVKRWLNPDPSDFKGDLLPVEQVSWHDAIEFCARLRRLTSKKYRLPSEAEWEYACRAGTTTPYYFGENLNQNLANYGGNVRKTTPLGRYSANAFGLQDMHGNVWEWCEDCWHDNYQNAPTDGSSWNENYSQSSLRMLRGGSWDYHRRDCRSAIRYGENADNGDFDYGFRLALFLP
jgi:formylglycine-generating enzyme required for sulfatase activity